jgi:hypothetical protein
LLPDAPSRVPSPVRPLLAVTALPAAVFLLALILALATYEGGGS